MGNAPVAAALVVGIGNPLRGDDGVGAAVIDALRGRLDDDRVVLSACHQLTPEFAEAVSGVARVVFVDASVNAAPGTVTCSAIARGSETDRFTHAVTPEVVVGLALALYGRAGDAFIVSVGASAFEPGQPLSAPVRDAIPGAVERVLALLA